MQEVAKVKWLRRVVRITLTSQAYVSSIQLRFPPPTLVARFPLYAPKLLSQGWLSCPASTDRAERAVTNKEQSPGNLSQAPRLYPQEGTVSSLVPSSRKKSGFGETAESPAPDDIQKGCREWQMSKRDRGTFSPEIFPRSFSPPAPPAFINYAQSWVYPVPSSWSPFCTPLPWAANPTAM